jgi:hypothetical protein
MERLFRLRTDQIANLKKIEIDQAVEYAVERLPPACREMRLSDFMRNSNMTMTDMNCLLFPSNYDSRSDAKKKSGCCQTTPPPKRKTQEHQTQTPVYTTHKRSRAEMENAELVSKIKTQLANEPQHVILPATGEYAEMPPNKKHQIVNILNAIVSTYEDIVASEEDSLMVPGPVSSSFISIMGEPN